MLKRRTSEGIIGEILRRGPANKTQIMYSINLSHKQIGSYIDFLMDRGLIRKEQPGGKPVHYMATDEGKHLLNQIDTVIATLDLDEAEGVSNPQW